MGHGRYDALKSGARHFATRQVYIRDAFFRRPVGWGHNLSITGDVVVKSIIPKTVGGWEGGRTTRFEAGFVHGVHR